MTQINWWSIKIIANLRHVSHARQFRDKVIRFCLLSLITVYLLVGLSISTLYVIKKQGSLKLDSDSLSDMYVTLRSFCCRTATFRSAVRVEIDRSINSEHNRVSSEANNFSVFILCNRFRYTANVFTCCTVLFIAIAFIISYLLLAFA